MHLRSHSLKLYMKTIIKIITNSLQFHYKYALDIIGTARIKDWLSYSHSQTSYSKIYFSISLCTLIAINFVSIVYFPSKIVFTVEIMIFTQFLIDILI